MKHVSRMIRDTDSGLRRAVCNCGQTFASKELSEVEAWMLAEHERPQREIPLRIEGFVSGLPDDLYGTS